MVGNIDTPVHNYETVTALHYAVTAVTKGFGTGRSRSPGRFVLTSRQASPAHFAGPYGSRAPPPHRHRRVVL
jgi:hypothetical protein